MPVGTITWTAQSSKAQMGRVMSLIAIPIVLAPTLGPTIGGLLIQGIDWRAIFWLNVPFGVVGVVLALRLLPRSRGGDAGRLDVTGLILASAGVVGITYGLAALAGFVARALRVKRPLLDLRPYASRARRAGQRIRDHVPVGARDHDCRRDPDHPARPHRTPHPPPRQRVQARGGRH